MSKNYPSSWGFAAREAEIRQAQQRQMKRNNLMDSVVTTTSFAGPVQGRDPDPIGTAIKNDPLNKQGFVFGSQDERRAYMSNPDKQPGSGKSIYQRLTPQEYGALNLAAQEGDATAKNELDKRFKEGQRYIMDSDSAQALKSNAKNNKSNRPNYKPLSAAEEAKRDAEARQQEDMKTRDLQFRLQQEARASEGEPYYNPYPLNNDPYQASRLRAQGLTPDQNQAAINARMRGELAPTKVSKEDDNSFTIQPISNRSKGQTNTGYLAVEPDGTQRWMTQSDWETPQGQKLLKSMGFSSNDGNYSRINELANNALGGKFGKQANAALKQRAAAGDPQAANILENLNLAQNGKPAASNSGMVSQQEATRLANEDPERYDQLKRAGQLPGSKFAPPKAKTPKRGESQSVPDPASAKPIIVPPKVTNADQFAQIRRNQAAANAGNKPSPMTAAARKAQQDALDRMNQQAQARNALQKLGYKDQSDFLNKGGKFQDGKNATSRGGGRSGGRGRGPTAKERNDEAKKKASQAAERSDKKRLEESYREQYGALSTPSSRKFWDDVEKRKAGQPSSGASGGGSRSGNNLNSSGFTANQQDYFNNPQRLAANAEAYRQRAAAEKNPEIKARLARLAASTQELADRAGGSPKKNPLKDIKPLSDQGGSTPTTPASDPADIGVDIGGPNTSVPGTTWQSTPSASTGGSGQGDASGALIGWLKKRKLGLV